MEAAEKIPKKLYVYLDTTRGLHHRHGGKDVSHCRAGHRVRHAGGGGVRCGAVAAGYAVVAGVRRGADGVAADVHGAAVRIQADEVSAIRDADRIIGLLEASEIKNPQLVINRLRPNMVKKGEMMEVEDIVDLLSIDLIGVVPDDEFIITQTNKGEPVVTNHRAPSGKAYTEIARRILGENVEITIPGENKGFFTKLKHFFKRK